MAEKYIQAVQKVRKFSIFTKECEYSRLFDKIVNLLLISENYEDNQKSTAQYFWHEDTKFARRWEEVQGSLKILG